jgi:hypothetical protein
VEGLEVRTRLVRYSAVALVVALLITGCGHTARPDANAKPTSPARTAAAVGSAATSTAPASPAVPERVISRRVAFTNSDRYTFNVEYDFVTQAPTVRVADEKPGYQTLLLPLRNIGFQAHNTTQEGRLHDPYTDLAPYGDLRVGGFWPDNSVACKQPSTIDTLGATFSATFPKYGKLCFLTAFHAFAPYQTEGNAVTIYHVSDAEVADGQKAFADGPAFWGVVTLSDETLGSHCSVPSNHMGATINLIDSTEGVELTCQA